jgi:8-oxo-dGTP pyrophosphatase MutT (NUDIX family)
MPQEKSAGAVIFRMVGGVPHYLLLHYPSGHWEFAKGHIEKGEKPEAAARREIQEETGITDIQLLPGFKQYAKYFFRKNYDLIGEAKKTAPWVFKLVVFYLAETVVEKVMISNEHKGFAWLPFEEAFKKLTFKNAKALLAKANDFVISAKGLSNSQSDSKGTGVNL